MDGDSKTNLPFRPRGLSSKESNSQSSNGLSTTKGSQDHVHPKASKVGHEGKSNSQKYQGKPKGSSKDKSEGNTKKVPTASAATMTELPDFIIKRNTLFDELMGERDAEILAKDHPEINVTLNLGLDREGKPRPIQPVAAKAWESTPGSFLRHVDKDISNEAVIAKVDDKILWDLDRPLEYACQVSYLPFTSAEGKNVFWHSSAHVLGEAAECQYNCLLSHGPPVEQGFFYDMALPEG